jgi:hypothetical protein
MPIKKNISDEEEESTLGKLNPKQEIFCQLYTSKEFYWNWVQTYIEVYKPDQNAKNWYKNACSMASQILSNLKVYTRINELLDSSGLNDQFVDKQLLFLVSQHEEKWAKLWAIKEYNALKKRITQKVEHSGKVSLDSFMDKVTNG